MFRAIRNILLLLVVGFIASGLPLYADTITFDRPIGATAQSNISMDVQLNQISTTEQKITVLLSTDNKPVTISFNSTNPLSIDLYHDDLQIKTLDPELLSQIITNKFTDSIEITKENPLSFEFSINQEELDIPDGDYRLKIKPNLTNPETNIPAFNVATSFTSDLQYIASLESINKNQTALNLYFPDPQANLLIPITRVIPYTNTPLRYTVNNLEEGPNPALGLPEGSPIPPQAKLSLKNGIAGVYLPADIGTYDTNSTDASIAMNSLINSLTTIDGVKGVQFYFGNKIREIGFHDRQVDKPFYPYEGPNLYAGTISNTNRILLTPLPIYEEKPTVESIYAKLKYNGYKDHYRYHLQPALPDSVELISYSVKENILTLNLSEAFLMVYPDHKDKKIFMLEAMLYSFTSLPEVDGMILLVEGEVLSSFEGRNLTNPIYPSKYINPEK